MCIDIKKFCICAPMDGYKYTITTISFSPEHIIQENDLRKKVRNSFIYLEIRRSIYGSPQAGMLSNKYLKEKLPPHRYYEAPCTPNLWKHIYRTLQFSLVVDNFGVKYVGKEHVYHLILTLKSEFTISEY